MGWGWGARSEFWHERDSLGWTEDRQCELRSVGRTVGAALQNKLGAVVRRAERATW